jgi:hypothetical protein
MLGTRPTEAEGTVKTDDPRLENARKEMKERVEKYNALTLSVIKSHLAVEQAMDTLFGSCNVSSGVRSGDAIRFPAQDKDLPSDVPQ